MTTLSIDQVATLALTQLNPNAATIATAIAMRESGGQVEVHADASTGEPLDDSYGLWQINRKAWPQFSPAMLTTASGNYAAMLVVSNHGTNWGPWQIGGDPLARTNPSAAAQAVTRASGSPVALPADGNLSGDNTGVNAVFSNALGIDTIGTMVGNLGNAAKWVASPGNWLRIVEGLLGFGGVILGIILVARSLRSGSS